MSKLKIVILSGSTGGGHVKAANSLEAYANKFEEAEVYNIDVIRYMTLFFKKFYADAYINIVNNFPLVYKQLYDFTDHGKDSHVVLNQMRYHFENLFTVAIRLKLRKIKPDYIIFTHFLPAEHLNKTILNDKYAKKYAVVVTDFDVHWLWVQKHMDCFFVANDESAYKLADRGISPESIHVTGIPIEPPFAEKYDKTKVKLGLGLKPEENAVLFMSGAAGVGNIDELVTAVISKSTKPFKLLVLTGSNKDLFNKIKKIESQNPDRVMAVPYTNKVYEYMAASEFAVTKTGELTSSECIAMGLPVIAVNPIPGQEVRNAAYLMEKGVGLAALDQPSLIYKMEKLLTDKTLLADMQNRARSISKPLAGHNILNTLLNG